MGTEPGDGRGRHARRRAPTELEAMRVEVERRMVRGDRFSDVEDVIDASALSADEQSALWLLAWSYVNWRAQRREARAHLAAFAARERGASAGRSQMLRLVL